MITIKFKKLHPIATDPVRGPGDAGWDLTCVEIVTTANKVSNFHTGIAVEIPEGYFGLLRPRSSIRNTFYCVATSGVIDASYRGELIFPLRDVDRHGRRYYVGDRICQLIILPLPEVAFEQVAELSTTARGDKGFGSTGK